MYLAIASRRVLCVYNYISTMKLEGQARGVFSGGRWKLVR